MAADILTVPTIMNIAKYAQALAMNETALLKIMSGANLDEDIGAKIWAIRMTLAARIDKNPDDPTIRDSANYLFAILGKYGLAAQNVIGQATSGAPVVTGPSNQTVSLGGTASFTIVITTSLSPTITWYKNGQIVPGQTSTTYSFVPTLGDSGSVIVAVVSNAAGSTSSSTATLTVTSSLAADYYFGDTDYFAALAGGTDSITYNGSVAILTGQPISIPFPSGAGNNKCNVIRYPNSQGQKTVWFNTNLNQGQIPDSVYNSIVTIGANYYIISRGAMSLDTTAPAIYS